MEERKNFEIHNLIQTHNKLYKEMKDYYNDITLNSVNLINGLKVDAVLVGVVWVVGCVVWVVLCGWLCCLGG